MRHGGRLIILKRVHCENQGLDVVVASTARFGLFMDLAMVATELLPMYRYGWERLIQRKRIVRFAYWGYRFCSDSWSLWERSVDRGTFWDTL